MSSGNGGDKGWVHASHEGIGISTPLVSAALGQKGASVGSALVSGRISPSGASFVTPIGGAGVGPAGASVSVPFVTCVAGGGGPSKCAHQCAGMTGEPLAQCMRTCSKHP